MCRCQHFLIDFTGRPVRFLCRVDYSRGEQVTCRPRCERGYFSLPGMTECTKWLTCKEIESGDFKVFEALGGGAVKNVSAGTTLLC